MAGGCSNSWLANTSPSELGTTPDQASAEQPQACPVQLKTWKTQGGPVFFADGKVQKRRGWATYTGFFLPRSPVRFSLPSRELEKAEKIGIWRGRLLLLPL